MELKGVLLHGGHGTRLRPLTYTGPKQLIPVAGKPISQYCLEDMREAGVKEIAIILGDLMPEKVMEHYEDESRFGVNIQYIHQGAPKGIAHAVYLAKDFVENAGFVVYLGDNLLRSGIKQYLEEFKAHDYDAMVLLTKVPDPGRFGVAQFDESGRLVGLVEKPKEPPSQFALTGIYFFKPIVFKAVEQLKPSWRGELEITEAIQLLLHWDCKVGHRFVEGWWKDTGTSEDITEANRLILDYSIKESEIKGALTGNSSVEGRVRILEGTAVKDGSIIRGPTYVGKNCVVGPNTYIGPYTSIGDNCIVVNSEIENSVIMNDCKINTNGRRILNSLIGPNVTVTSSPNGMPKGYRFILGDRSTVVLS